LVQSLTFYTNSNFNIKKYTSLIDLRGDHPNLFNQFEKDLDAFFMFLKPELQKMYQKVGKEKALSEYDTILYYISDLDYWTGSIQIFCKKSADPPGYWDFRGGRDILGLNVLDSPFINLERAVERLLTVDIDDWFKLEDENYPIMAMDHVIFRKELPEYMSEKIASFFASSYELERSSWEKSYLDFLPDSDFHNGELFDLVTGKWVKIK